MKLVYQVILVFVAAKIILGIAFFGGSMGKKVYDTYYSSTPTKSFVQKRSTACTVDADCGNGVCVQDGSSLVYNCQCNSGYVDDNNGTVCGYEQKSELVAFLLSFFIGVFGADWFYLCKGNGLWIFAGIMKLLTLGFFGIWWLVDWIRILCGAFGDGNGYALNMNM